MLLYKHSCVRIVLGAFAERTNLLIVNENRPGFFQQHRGEK